MINFYFSIYYIIATRIVTISSKINFNNSTNNLNINNGIYLPAFCKDINQFSEICLVEYIRGVDIIVIRLQTGSKYLNLTLESLLYEPVRSTAIGLLIADTNLEKRERIYTTSLKFIKLEYPIIYEFYKLNNNKKSSSIISN
ncbi:hypothetical protein MJ1_0359 [Nanobdella aerobiophila]|uniref:Uncharacterized protein n=1 Tax=Nanobdella aerobiophila TaxID=2586965 RepID=A0A915SCM7_9ARCH|nr:hypothetical protein [Nanobdella aerobiophila]BBL45523.1 hypothetical protein MJ1_0359 [Nanobdella aerobiophila]